jgi:hypothetical protein
MSPIANAYIHETLVADLDRAPASTPASLNAKRRPTALLSTIGGFWYQIEDGLRQL